MTKVLGLMGSPRAGQHTDTMLQTLLHGATAAGAVTERLSVANLSIKPCQSCYACAKLGHCVVKDQMQHVYKKLAEADVIVLASPLYFFGLSAQLKALVDRCQVCWSRQNELQLPPLDPVKRRIGFFLASGGAPNRGGTNFDPAIAIAKVFFIALGAEYAGEMVIANTDTIALADRPEDLDKLHALGQSLVQEVLG